MFYPVWPEEGDVVLNPITLLDPSPLIYILIFGIVYDYCFVLRDAESYLIFFATKLAIMSSCSIFKAVSN